MRYLKYAALLGVLLFTAARANAQVRVGVAIGAGPVGVGPAPACPYGYFGYYPYACAPYGYYGWQYFVNGAFIGAGPWYHDPRYYDGHPYYARRFYRHPARVGTTGGPVVHGYVHEGYRGDFHDRR